MPNEIIAKTDNKPLLRAWVASLRSGNFIQGKGKFEDDGKYCCLGVLCVVAGEPPNIRGGMGNWYFTAKTLSGNDTNPEYCHVLATMNDSGVPFPEIADKIEKDFSL